MDADVVDFHYLNTNDDDPPFVVTTLFNGETIRQLWNDGRETEPEKYVKGEPLLIECLHIGVLTLLGHPKGGRNG